MKDNAIVSNMINRTSVIVKTNNASAIVDCEISDERERYSLHSLGFDNINTFSNYKIGSANINAADQKIVSKNKVNDTKEIRYTYAPAAPNKIRYIRDWLSGSTVNRGNHWVELQVIENSTGINLAKGKVVTSETGAITNAAVITDGVVSTAGNAYGYTSDGANYNIVLDLEEEYCLSDVTIKLWHYYADGRTYYGTKTEVSRDGVDWIVLRDSAVSGTYAETVNGQTFDLSRVVPQPIPSLKLENNTDSVLDNDEFSTNVIVDSKESLVVDCTEKKGQDVNLPVVQAKSSTIQTNIIADSIFVTSKDKRDNDHVVTNNFNYASITVTTKIPVDTSGDQLAGGEGLSSLDLELQPLSYIKIALGFNERKITSIANFPPGLTVKDGFIEGSPTISGQYNAKIYLDNGTYIGGIIKVYSIERIL